MIITIHQKKLSIGDQYDIALNGASKYTASRAVLQWLAEILVFDLPSKRQQLKINRRFQWFKATYEISFGHSQCLFKTISYLKSHYQCQCAADTYDIYAHRGRKYSIFKNNRQVAYWEHALLTWLEGDQYRITADDDSCAELLIAFCLIIDNYVYGNHGESLLTINWGYFGLEAKPFNPAWEHLKLD